MIMNAREFFRFHLLKVLLAFVALQLIIFGIIELSNQKPKAIRDYTSVVEGKKIKILPLSNDVSTDESQTLSLSHISSPKHGAVKQNGKLVIYSPGSGYTGTDSFAYTITDGRHESKEAYVVIEVNKDLPPVANRDSVVAYNGKSIFINVLDNDKDAEGDSINIKYFSEPLFGELKLSKNKLIYKANSPSLQTDSFNYTITDGKNISNKARVTITIKSTADPCYPWVSYDLGNITQKGSFSCLNKQIIINCSGNDIWNSFDGFRYTYQYLSGDCEMVTKVESFETIEEWAKAGIMLRESLNGGSKSFFVCVTNKNGIAVNQRLNNGDPTENGDAKPNIKAPYWVKLSRKGNAINYYCSDNGNNWSSMGNVTVPLKEEVYMGFAVTSHNNSNMCKAVFGNYKLLGKPVKIDSY
jgi:regulation of enolase protein 1 (concanavalin A-like superfamily)